MGASDRQKEERDAKKAAREKPEPKQESYDKPGSGHRERSPRKDVKEAAAKMVAVAGIGVAGLLLLRSGGGLRMAAAGMSAMIAGVGLTDPAFAAENAEENRIKIASADEVSLGDLPGVITPFARLDPVARLFSQAG